MIETPTVIVEKIPSGTEVRDAFRMVDPAIEETLPLESPMPQHLFRRTTKDVEVSSQHNRTGDPVNIFPGAANRDPRAFPDPDTFRLDRDTRLHVAFGTSIYYRLGASLRRLRQR